MNSDTPQLFEDFHRDWSHYHGDQPPLAHVLRERAQTPWVRFHALPDSKRYAENEAEQREILRRANVLGAEILGADTLCWLVQCRVEEHPKTYWTAGIRTESTVPRPGR